jgi:hypothetical protein
VNLGVAVPDLSVSGGDSCIFWRAFPAPTWAAGLPGLVIFFMTLPLGQA